MATQEQIIQLFHELRESFSDKWHSWPPTPGQIVSSHALMLEKQVSLPKEQRSTPSMKNSWRAILELKDISEVETWLRQHGRTIVEYFMAEGH